MKAATLQGARSVNYATSPLLASKTPVWRSRFVVFMVALGSLVLIARAAYVQVWKSDFFVEKGDERLARTLTLPASRGRITDRHGSVLATSVPTFTVIASPRNFVADDAQRAELARLLGLPRRDLEEKMGGGGDYALLRRQVDDVTWRSIQALKVKGLHTEREYVRRYPEGEAAAHVVGFTNIDEIGQEGMELAFQKQLKGVPGSRGVLLDRLGRTIDDQGELQSPVNGADVTLSIDSKVQFFAWQRIRDMVEAQNAKGGSVVVLDAQSGEVLALANYPSFDPADRHHMTGSQLRNRALTDIFEPGSTMKPFVVSWALETKRVTPSTPILTAPGSMVVTGTAIKDAHPHGMLTVAEVIQKSSNVGTVRMAMQFSPKEMWELYAQLGFGQKPQLEFPGAVTGRLRPFKSWRPIEQATMSYGYGVSASLLQLARAYTVFTRDGEIIPVTMLKREAPPTGVRVISEKTAQDVRQMLHLVSLPGGTATKSQTEGYTVGGKTGTANKQEGRGYASNKYRAWFVGLAPVSKPRIIVGVMVDEPSKGVYYGGDVAAPVFSQVVQQTLRLLNVPTDLEVKPGIKVKSVPDEVESF